MHSKTKPLSVSWTHTLAVLRGAAEGDDSKYLGSITAMRLHARPLLTARLIAELTEDEDEDNDGFHQVTDKGRAFYDKHLAGLPPNTQCRANYWATMPEMSSALMAIVTECEHQILDGDA